MWKGEVMRYLVVYYNGKGNREKCFPTLETAEAFKLSCGDLQATLWKEVEHGL
jgi:hypothetical protein